MAENSARISLIYPNDNICYKFARAHTKRMPLGLAYIAQALLVVGHQVKVIDGALYDLSIEETVKRSLSNDPQFIGIGCSTPVYQQAVGIVALVKKLSPTTTVILGGPHVSALPEPTLKTSKADFVCIGEGEESIVAIVDCVLSNKNPAAISSIAYNWRNYQGHTNEYGLRLHKSEKDTVKAIDLNKIPIPARDIFDWPKYVDCGRDIMEPQTAAIFSRGCVGKCSFCRAANTLIRWRKIDNVIEELKQIQQMGIKNLAVMDDSYTVNKKRILDISNGILKNGIKLNISVQLRLDQIDEEICEAMFASGIRYVGPGIESGDEAIIKQIGKGFKENKDFIRSKIRLLQNYHWRIRCSYVMGMPEETEEQIMETIEFAKELSADENAFSIVVPYPGSQLWYMAKAKGKVNDYMDFSKFLYYHEIGCNLSAVCTKRLLELHEFAYEYVGNLAYRLNDDHVSSGPRPHTPYLASEAFRRFREEAKKNLKNYATKNQIVT